MKTDGAPEVQPSGQDSNPIILDPALVVSLIDVQSPGDSMVHWILRKAVASIWSRELESAPRSSRQ